jgi:hypothetical protein
MSSCSSGLRNWMTVASDSSVTTDERELIPTGCKPFRLLSAPFRRPDKLLIPTERSFRSSLLSGVIHVH